MPGCQEDKRDSRSLFETELVRNRKPIRSRNGNVLSVAALRLVSYDLVRLAQTIPAIATVITNSTADSRSDQNHLAPRMPANQISYVSDFSCDVTARYVGKRNSLLPSSASCPNVQVIQGTRFYSN